MHIFILLPPYYCFVIFVLIYCSIVIIIVLQCVPRMYLISTEVKTLKEYSNSDNIRRQVIYIYLLRIFVYVCLYIIDLFYICELFVSFYSCFMIFMSHVFTEVYTTLQHNNSNNKEEGRYNMYINFVFYILLSLCSFVYFII